MLSRIIITLLLRGLPEAFIHMFGLYTFAGKKIDGKKYILASICSACIMMFARMLPVSYGIHTILVIMSVMLLAVSISGISVMQSITATIINTVIQFLAEGINIYLIVNVFKMDMSDAMSTPLSKAIYGIPSLILFFVFVAILYRLINRKLGKEYV